jgi:hypothetical protein
MVHDLLKALGGQVCVGCVLVCVCGVCRRRNHSETKARYRCNVEEG